MAEEEPPPVHSRHSSGIETWRLSRIEEELSQLELGSHASEQAGGMADGYMERRAARSLPGSGPGTPHNPRHAHSGQLLDGQQHAIYNKIVIKPAYKNIVFEDTARLAVERITDKYDSLDNVRQYHDYGDYRTHDIPGRQAVEMQEYNDASARDRPQSCQGVVTVRHRQPKRNSSFSADADVRPFSGRISQLYDSDSNLVDTAFQEDFIERQIRIQEERLERLSMPRDTGGSLSKARSLPRDVNLSMVLRPHQAKVANIHGRRSVNLSESIGNLQEAGLVPEQFRAVTPVRDSPDPSLYRKHRPRTPEGPRRAGSEYRERGPEYRERDSQYRDGERSVPRSRSTAPVHDVLLSQQDLMRVEVFYNSHKTKVYVSRCQARLYFSQVRTSLQMEQDISGNNGWRIIKSGIPVLVLDTGESRRQRRLYILVAERQTGFALWRDAVNQLTNYKSPTINFHTMHLSSDHSKVVGLRFDDPGCAADFFKAFQKFTADPHDDAFSINGKESSKSKLKTLRKAAKLAKKKYKPPAKKDISHPVCFTHVTCMDPRDARGSSRPTEGASGANAQKKPKQGILKKSVKV